MPVEVLSSDSKHAFDCTLDSVLISPVGVKKIKSTEESDEQNNGIVKEESQKAKNCQLMNWIWNIQENRWILNSGISSAYEDEDEENSLDNNFDEEDTVELADISFNLFVGSLKTNNKN